MTMSPTTTSRICTSPTMAPLHDGPFRVVVTTLSGPGMLPFKIDPPVTSVPAPETMMYVSV